MFFQFAHSQIKFDIGIQFGPQFSKLENYFTATEFSNSFEMGYSYSGELGIMIKNKIKLNIGFVSDWQKNTHTYYEQNSFYIITTNTGIPIVLEYYIPINERLNLIPGIGIQFSKNWTKYVEPYANGLPCVPFIDHINRYFLIRTGVNYQINNFLSLELVPQLKLPILLNRSGTLTLIGCQIGFNLFIGEVSIDGIF